MLPSQTTEENLTKMINYLSNKPGFVNKRDMQKAIEKHGDNRKIESLIYIGLIDKEGEEIKLSDAGRDYERSNEERRRLILFRQLYRVPLFYHTLEWIKNYPITNPTTIDVASYWNDNYSEYLEGKAVRPVTEAAIFFLRFLGIAGIGDFVQAGAGRKTHLKVDPNELNKAYENVTRGRAVGGETEEEPPEKTATPPTKPTTELVSPYININIQVHIDAEASKDQIEQLFKNLDKYVLKKYGK
jgi:hypothetical protein